MSQFSARLTRTGNGIPIALDYCLGMFVNEFIFSFALLSFAALLCLFGVVILIDDGLATGSTMRAAAAALGRQNPARIVVAVPVSAPETCEEFRGEVDEIVCAVTPAPFLGVGLWYKDFSQTTDEEVRELLQRLDLALP